MGQRGPKPRPEALRVLRGLPARNTTTAEHRFRPAVSLAEPDWLSLLPGDADEAVRATAARTWRTMADRLTAAGLLSEVDAPLLCDFAIGTARVEQLERTISLDGLMLRGRDGGLVRHPALPTLNGYRAHLRAVGDRLGVGPGSRSNLKVPEQPTERGEIW